MANEIVTQKGREKMVKARAGDITLPPITHMAFGDGGTDENGVVITPTTLDSSLKHELLKAEIDSYTFISETTCRYTYRIKRTELGGKKINEVGLFDSEGDLVIVKAFSDKGKDADMEMIFEIDDKF